MAKEVIANGDYCINDQIIGLADKLFQSPFATTITWDETAGGWVAYGATPFVSYGKPVGKGHLQVVVSHTKVNGTIYRIGCFRRDIWLDDQPVLSERAQQDYEKLKRASTEKQQLMISLAEADPGRYATPLCLKVNYNDKFIPPKDLEELIGSNRDQLIAVEGGNNTVFGNYPPEELSPSAVRTLKNLIAGAKAFDLEAEAKAWEKHAGVQQKEAQEAKDMENIEALKAYTLDLIIKTSSLSMEEKEVFTATLVAARTFKKIQDILSQAQGIEIFRQRQEELAEQLYEKLGDKLSETEMDALTSKLYSAETPEEILEFQLSLEHLIDEYRVTQVLKAQLVKKLKTDVEVLQWLTEEEIEGIKGRLTAATKPVEVRGLDAQINTLVVKKQQMQQLGSQLNEILKDQDNLLSKEEVENFQNQLASADGPDDVRGLIKDAEAKINEAIIGEILVKLYPSLTENERTFEKWRLAQYSTSNLKRLLDQLKKNQDPTSLS